MAWRRGLYRLGLGVTVLWLSYLPATFLLIILRRWSEEEAGGGWIELVSALSSRAPF